MDHKEILMHAVSKILEASKESIKILRDTPVSSLKVIRGIAKGTRDPDPLSSTMVQINRKYPITIDSSHPLYHVIPKEMIGPDDMHLYKRKICKIEAVSHFLNFAPEVTEEEKEVSKAFYVSHDELMRKYMSIDWERSGLCFGETVLQKVYAPTRCPPLNIDKSMREAMVLQVLCPDLTIPYDEIDHRLVQYLEAIAKSSLSNKMTFMQQARILLNQLDPAVKLQPLPPGSSSWVGVFRYAISHSRWALKVMTKEDNEDLMKEKFISLCTLNDVCLTALRKKAIDPMSLRDVVRNITYRSERIESSIKTLKDRNSVKLKALMVLLNIKTNMTTIINDVTFAPVPSRIRPMNRSNLSGVRYKSYRGNEVVYFQNRDVTGMFVHDEEIITSVIISLASPSDIRSTLARIAQYCRFGFSGSSARTRARMEYETYSRVISNPAIIFKCSPKYTIGTHGIVQIRSDFEFNSHEGEFLNFDENFNVVNSTTNQTMSLEVAKTNLILSRDLVLPDCILALWAHPIRRLWFAIVNYMRNFKTLENKIKNSDWNWCNGTIHELMEGEKESIHYTARSLCKALLQSDKRDNMLISFCYCFASAYSEKSATRKMYKFSWSGCEIDLLASTGLVHRKNGAYYVQSNKISVISTGFNIDAYCPKILKQVQISADIHEGAPTYSVRTANTKLSSIPEGTKFNVLASGRMFGCVKNVLLDSSINETIERQYNLADDLIDPCEILLDLKRVFDDDGNTSMDEPSTSKKARY